MAFILWPGFMCPGSEKIRELYIQNELQKVRQRHTQMWGMGKLVARIALVAISNLPVIMYKKISLDMIKHYHLMIAGPLLN